MRFLWEIFAVAFATLLVVVVVLVTQGQQLEPFAAVVSIVVVTVVMLLCSYLCKINCLRTICIFCSSCTFNTRECGMWSGESNNVHGIIKCHGNGGAFSISPVPDSNSFQIDFTSAKQTSCSCRQGRVGRREGRLSGRGANAVSGRLGLLWAWPGGNFIEMLTKVHIAVAVAVTNVVDAQICLVQSTD